MWFACSVFHGLPRSLGCYPHSAPAAGYRAVPITSVQLQRINYNALHLQFVRARIYDG